MRRSQIVFFLIILSAIVIVGLGVALQGGSDSDDNGDNPESENNTTNSEPIALQIAVTPLMENWVRAAVIAYERTNPRVGGREVNLQVVVQDSIEVWQGSSPWTVLNHPQVWIPESNYALNYAQAVDMRYASFEPSLASTPIIWGAYQSRAEVIATQYGTLDGQTIQQAAVAESWAAIGGDSTWRFVKMAFSRPDSTDSGLASLLTLAGIYANDPQLTTQIMNDAGLKTWLEPIIESVPNFSNLGLDPADRMANTRQSTAEIGLLPESQWLAHYSTLSAVEPIVLNYPVNYLLLDFPYAVWDGNETSDEERQAAENFGEFLLTESQQRAVGEAGFRPAQLTDLTQFAPFNAEGVQLTLTGSPISLPDRAGVSSLVRWFEGYRTAP